MPIYEINMNGRVFELDAPDQQSALAAIGSIGKERPAAPAMSGMDMAVDVGKSAGVGLAEGVIGTVGMPGDIRSGMSAATDAIGSRMGVSPETLGTVKDVAQRVGRTLPFGLSAIAAGPSSDAITKQVEGVTGEFYKPQSLPGEVVRTVGQFAPNALAPGSLPVRAGVNVLAPALASEAAGQYMKGSPNEGVSRVAAALAGGGVASVGASVANARRSLIPGMSGPSSRVLERAITPDAERRLAELGPDAMLLDAGPATRQWSQGVANKPGEGMAHLTDAVTRRNQGTNARLSNEMDATLGPAVSPARLRLALDDQQAGLRPLYQQVTQLNEPVDLRHVYDQLRGAIPQEAGQTQSALRKLLDYVAPADPNTRQRIVRTHPREVLNIRQAIDDDLPKLAETPKAHAIVTQFRGLIDEALGEAVPDLKILDGTYSNLARGKEALTRGSQILDSGKEAIRPEDLIRERQGLSLPHREAMRHGTRAELDRLVGTTGNDLEALKKAVKSDGDWNRVKLAEIFGAREAERIFRAVDREAAFRDAYNKITQNSQTAPRQEVTRMLNLETPAAPDVRGTTLTGLALSGVSKGWDAIRNQRDAIRMDRMTNDLAHAFTTTGRARDDLLVAIRDAQSTRKKGANATRDFLIRAMANAQAARRR